MNNKIIEIAFGAFMAKVVEEFATSFYDTNDIFFKGLVSLVGGVIAVFCFEKFIVKSDEPLFNKRTNFVLITLLYFVLTYHFVSYKVSHSAAFNDFYSSTFIRVIAEIILFVASFGCGVLGGAALSALLVSKSFKALLIALLLSIVFTGCLYFINGFKQPDSWTMIAGIWFLEFSSLMILAAWFTGKLTLQKE